MVDWSNLWPEIKALLLPCLQNERDWLNQPRFYADILVDIALLY